MLLIALYLKYRVATDKVVKSDTEYVVLVDLILQFLYLFFFCENTPFNILISSVRLEMYR